MRTKILRRLAGALAGLLLPALAPAQSYHAGDHVEFKPNQFQEIWEEGVIVKVLPESSPGLRQVVVRHVHPSPYNPTYYPEEAYSVQFVRPAGSAAGAPAEPVDEANASNAANARKEANATSAANAAAPADTALPAGAGPMTRQEILAYLRSHGYANGQPRHDVAPCRAIIEAIRRRGVVERLEAGRDDLAPIADNGCFGAQDTDVVAATQANLGAPTTPDWLAGTWVLYVVGGTVDTAHDDGWVYRRNESIAKFGFVEIAADGTYTWKLEPDDPPARYLHGRWRPATRAEMGLQGGAGIVLQHAAEGADWIAFKYMDPHNPAERFELGQVGRGV